jgi:hypothetical protein
MSFARRAGPQVHRKLEMRMYLTQATGLALVCEANLNEHLFRYWGEGWGATWNWMPLLSSSHSLVFS